MPPLIEPVGLRLVLGGNVFGWTADLDASFAILDAFYEAGGRMIDTAEGYSDWIPGHVGGESETVLGKWMAARGNRADMHIATKTGMYGKPGDLAPAKLAAAVEGSLKRLQTDYIDLYYAHRDETATDQAEAAQGFGALVTAGKVRTLGASNFTADRLATARAAAKAQGVAVSRDEARTMVYGMPYDDWKAKHQAAASDDQKAKFAQSHKH